MKLAEWHWALWHALGCHTSCSLIVLTRWGRGADSPSAAPCWDSSLPGELCLLQQALLSPVTVKLFVPNSNNMLSHNRVPEQLVRSITWQTLQAVNFCHKHNVSPLSSADESCDVPLGETQILMPLS